MYKTFTMAAFGLLLTGAMAFAQLGTAPPTTTSVSVTVAAEAALTVATTTTLNETGTQAFSPYLGSTNFTYFIRTTKSGGTGTVTVQVTSDFSPAGGPSVGTPPTAGDALTYISTVAAPGTLANGTASTGSATNAATFGADAHSAITGNTGSTAWTLTNDPKYQTGTFSATVTYTISAT